MADGVIKESGTPEQISNDFRKRRRPRASIQRQKQYGFHVESKYYDFAALTGELAQFCDRYRLPPARVANHLHMLVEESLGSIYGEREAAAAPSVSGVVRYSEADGELVTFEYSGMEGDFIETDTDEIRKRLLSALCDERQYTLADGVNRMYVTLA